MPVAAEAALPALGHTGFPGPPLNPQEPLHPSGSALVLLPRPLAGPGQSKAGWPGHASAAGVESRAQAPWRARPRGSGTGSPDPGPWTAEGSPGHACAVSRPLRVGKECAEPRTRTRDAPPGGSPALGSGSNRRRMGGTAGQSARTATGARGAAGTLARLSSSATSRMDCRLRCDSTSFRSSNRIFSCSCFCSSACSRSSFRWLRRSARSRCLCSLRRTFSSRFRSRSSSSSSFCFLRKTRTGRREARAAGPGTWGVGSRPARTAHFGSSQSRLRWNPRNACPRG